MLVPDRHQLCKSQHTPHHHYHHHHHRHRSPSCSSPRATARTSSSTLGGSSPQPHKPGRLNSGTPPQSPPRKKGQVSWSPQSHGQASLHQRGEGEGATSPPLAHTCLAQAPSWGTRRSCSCSLLFVWVAKRVSLGRMGGRESCGKPLSGPPQPFFSLALTIHAHASPPKLLVLASGSPVRHRRDAGGTFWRSAILVGFLSPLVWEEAVSEHGNRWAAAG
jgi:hypothetical protein